MNCTELRIGNLIFYREEKLSIVDNLGHYFSTIDSFYGLQNGSDDIRDYEPIPLTEEWLLKFGFEKLNRDITAYKKGSLIVEWLFERWTGRLYYDAYTSILIIETKYVHQLQNLFFALTGNELKYE